MLPLCAQSWYTRVAINSLLTVLVMHQPGIAAEPSRLTIERAPSSGKPVFAWRGVPFYPLIYSEHFSKFTPQLIKQLQNQGFNALQIAIDASEARSPKFLSVMRACQQARIPVVLELNDWRLRELLIKQPDLNMVMSDGKIVTYFPDFANAETRRLHLEHINAAAAQLHPLVNRPIVAISVGAYDHFHLPDGEVHDDFVVPKGAGRDHTRLPYGRHVEELFCASASPAAADRLPTSLQAAGSREEWDKWLHFRRDLVTSWLQKTVAAVREQVDVPIGVSLDLNFSQQEQFATPPYAWSDELDFVSVYCYGPDPDAAYLPRLMRTVYREFSRAGVPMIGFLEFSSGLSGHTPGEIYAEKSAPFAAGLMTTGPVPGRALDQQRVDSFIGWASHQDKDGLRARCPDPADVLFVVDRAGIDLGQDLQDSLRRRGVTVDMIYVEQGRSVKDQEIMDHDLVIVGETLPIPDAGQSVRPPKFVRPEAAISILSKNFSLDALAPHQP
jgi:hypothetical protein